MKQALRTLVLLWMAAAVPLQAFATAAGICLGFHDEVVWVAGSQADDAVMAAGTVAGAADHGSLSIASDHGHHAGVHRHHDVNDKCGVCSACCASLALVPQPLGVPAVRSASEAIPFRPAAMSAAYLASLERPPKRLL